MREARARRLRTRGGLLRVTRGANVAGDFDRVALDCREPRTVRLQLLAEEVLEGAPLFGEVLARLV